MGRIDERLAELGLALPAATALFVGLGVYTVFDRYGAFEAFLIWFGSFGGVLAGARYRAPASDPKDPGTEHTAELRRTLDGYGWVFGTLIGVQSVGVAAVLLGIVNLVLAVTGHSGKGGAGTLIVYCALMFAAAYGMWTKRYVAVLLFQILLAVLVVFFFLSLLRASSVGDVVLSLALILEDLPGHADQIGRR